MTHNLYNHVHPRSRETDPILELASRYDSVQLRMIIRMHSWSTKASRIYSMSVSKVLHSRAK